MITRSLRFDDEVYDQLVKEAESRRVSFNWLVHQLCTEGLDRLQPQLRITTRVDM
jgi:predicted HicB family RNase H-like nuclease